MESYIIESNKKKSRIPARLDLAQSGTGLVLGLFMWVHMLLVGSIILGTGSFNFVAKTMELSFLSDTGHGFPIAVFFAVLTIFTLFIAHALLGVRKFPISWKQHRIMRDQMQMMNHTDTNLWYIQVVTGFLMFFLGSVHLYIMLTHPGSIDPYLSAERVVSGNMWFLYLVLLICVELHGTIGIYRLCMKWGWFAGKDPKASRAKLKLMKNRLTIFFLSVGVLALLVFVVIGISRRDRVGERYGSHKAAVETIQANEVAPDVKIGHPSSEAPAPEAPAPEASAAETGSTPEEALKAPGAEDGHGKEEAPLTGTAHDTEQPAEKH
ncbi:MAG: fumarate reductase cytochrome b subunit [Proteobacteria bacterium]|nr:fumarate reductase cytochrome b subunit [Pseudomonadota bacterium]